MQTHLLVYAERAWFVTSELSLVACHSTLVSSSFWTVFVFVRNIDTKSFLSNTYNLNEVCNVHFYIFMSAVRGYYYIFMSAVYRYYRYMCKINNLVQSFASSALGLLRVYKANVYLRKFLHHNFFFAANTFVKYLRSFAFSAAITYNFDW